MRDNTHHTYGKWPHTGHPTRSTTDDNRKQQSLHPARRQAQLCSYASWTQIRIRVRMRPERWCDISCVHVCRIGQRVAFLPSDYGDLGVRRASKAVKSTVNTERQTERQKRTMKQPQRISVTKTERRASLIILTHLIMTSDYYWLCTAMCTFEETAKKDQRHRLGVLFGAFICLEWRVNMKKKLHLLHGGFMQLVQVQSVDAIFSAKYQILV